MKKIWINGCFDVLHYGHFKLIEYAKSFDGKLVIGIDSDERVKYLKGNDRPFHTQEQRRFNLMQISGVDAVVTFDSEVDLENQLRLYQPDFFIIGDDYIGKTIIGAEYAGDIKYFPKVKGFSTTGLLDV